MKIIKLSPRLYTIAKLSESGGKIVDVGTDHGYIPVWLALNGVAESITATDIRRGPLESAERSALEHGVHDKIHFVLCDGLSYSGAANSDTVIIAGMGGETIISILQHAQWTKFGVSLLLQPQSKSDELCVWLFENDYTISDAVLVEDAGRLYSVLSVHGATGPCGELFPEEILLRSQDPLLARWLDEHITTLIKASEGMSLAKKVIGTDSVRKTLGRFIRAKEEVKTWLP